MLLDDTDVSAKTTSYLQICDDGVVHVLFLFLQEVETHGVESIRAQFVVPEEHLGETERKFLPIQKLFSTENDLSKADAQHQCGCR